MADFRDVLRQLAEGLPPGTAIPVLREWLLELLDTPRQAPAVDGDFTAAQVAERFRRKPSTVRGWCAEGRFPNAYHLNDREWKIPLADVVAYEDRQRPRQGVMPPTCPQPRRRKGQGPLSAHRDVEAA